MGLEAESNNAKKELNSLHCLIPSRFIEMFYFLLLANTNAPPVKNTADRIRYKVPIEVPVFGNSSSPAFAGAACATGAGDGSLASFAGSCSALAARGVASTRYSVASVVV